MLELPNKRFGRKSAVREAWLRALEKTAPIEARPGYLLPDAINDLAARFGDAPALLSGSECLSFCALSEQMNRYARWARAQGLEKGEAIALLMPNRPDYMAAWLGVTRAGGAAALLNTNLKGQSLAHAIRSVATKHLVIAEDLLERFRSAAPYLEHEPALWVRGTAGGSPFDMDIAGRSGAPLAPLERRDLTIDDRALYIYTSGTTGLPKAANVSHRRLMMWSSWFAGMLETSPRDRMYNCLPMYHSVGGTVAPGAVLLNGGSVFISEKFSRDAFWSEVTGQGCTLVQYVGELCRYLVTAPPHPLERAHKIRAFVGNGLRADVWESFKERFSIPQLLEFYAATEGNFSLFNVEERVGALGRVPPFLSHRFPAALIKHDVETGEPLRDAQGYCVPCDLEEAGEAIGRIAENAQGGRFEGYSDEAQSEKKVLRDVFVKGDAWYRTGDLMRKDEDGFFYFVDRIGDTFRWKGENVSTVEVEEAIASFPGIAQVGVYGVAVPKTEGHAGMVAIACDAALDLEHLRRHIAGRLPPYAAPLFVRLCRELEITETFKRKKGALVREGFDPKKISDPLYFDDRASKTYVRLDEALFRRVVNGEIRL
ncbi:MAG TPA: long-chain-acyl-CoA synthetase [Micropepsaceae bacterium]|nr:long-chain-acyl-CoA synthetase [Micropepsaceae bacterium]